LKAVRPGTENNYYKLELAQALLKIEIAVNSDEDFEVVLSQFEQLAIFLSCPAGLLNSRYFLAQ